MRRLIPIPFILAMAAVPFLFAPSGAQQPLPPAYLPELSQRYQVNVNKSYTSQTDALTVQQAAKGQKTVAFEAAWFYCSASTTFLIEQNGAAATATAATPQPLNISLPSVINAFTSSNAGTGNYVSNPYNCAGGSTVTVDLSRMYLTQNGGTAQNLSVVWPAISSYTGTAEVTIQWIERP